MNDKLDKYQKKAVKCKRKNILVLAGAGSGKTFVIVSRVKYLIHNLNIDPKEILCILFDTNELSRNLKVTYHR